MARRVLLPALLLIGLVGIAGAQDDAVDLKWKFKKGETFYQTLTTETNQKMKVMGMEVKQKPTQTFFFSWTPVEEKDKAWTIKQKIEGLKMEIEIGGNTISYDSTNPGAGANPLGDFFKALVGSEFILTVSPDMKVTKVEGRNEFLKKLIEANPQMKSAAGRHPERGRLEADGRPVVRRGARQGGEEGRQVEGRRPSSTWARSAATTPRTNTPMKARTRRARSWTRSA